MLPKCGRVLSHVYSTAMNGSINWPWSGAMPNKSTSMGSQDPTSYFSSPHDSRRKLGDLQDIDR